MTYHHTPTVFIRQHRQLHALLLEDQVWFSFQDLSRLLGRPLDERMVRKLDGDQKQILWVVDHDELLEKLMVSESGAYMVMLHYPYPENRHLRRWLTNEVIPALRGQVSSSPCAVPNQSLLQWPGLSVSILHWRDEPWIMLKDLPRMMPVANEVLSVNKPRLTFWQQVFKRWKR